MNKETNLSKEINGLKGERINTQREVQAFNGQFANEILNGGLGESIIQSFDKPVIIKKENRIIKILKRFLKTII